MWYLYILKSEKHGRLYVGMTGDLKRRIVQHNSKSGGYYTKRNGPFKLIFYEAYIEKQDAARAEKFFKSGYGREVLKNDKLKFFFEKASGVIKI